MIQPGRSALMVVLEAAALLLAMAAGAETRTPKCPFDSPGSSLSKQAHCLIYDAETGNLLQVGPGGREYPAGENHVYGFETVVTLGVQNARCSSAYNWQIDERQVAEAGAAFLGLDEVAGLIAAVEAPPAAHGVVPLETASIQPRTVADMAALLSTAQGIAELKTEILDEKGRLLRALNRLCRDIADYQRFVDRFTDEIEAPCSKDSDSIDCLLARLAPALARADSCRDLRDLVRETNGLLARYRTLRERIRNSPESGLPQTLLGDLDVLGERVATLLGKLDGALSAAEIARIASQVGSLKSSAGVSEAMLHHLKRLQAEFKDSGVTPGVLQDLARTFAVKPELKADWAEKITELENLLRQERQDSSASEAGVEDLMECGLSGTLAEIQKSSEDLSFGIKHLSTGFENGIIARNGALRRHLLALEGRAEASRDSELRVATSMGPWSTNHVVTVKVFEKKGLQLPDLEGLERVRLPAGALDEVVAQPPGSDADFEQVASQSYEVHKVYRFLVGGGPVLSAIGERDFAVRPFPRLDDAGEPVVNDAGEPISDLKAVAAGENDRSIEFGLFVTYLLRPLDLFPGEGTTRRAWGVTLGFGLEDPGENIFLGLSWLPTLGIQVTAGVHYGRLTVLQEGIVPEQTVLPAGTTAAPTRLEEAYEPYIGIVLDAKAFRRLLTGSS